MLEWDTHIDKNNNMYIEKNVRWFRCYLPFRLLYVYVSSPISPNVPYLCILPGVPNIKLPALKDANIIAPQTEISHTTV